MVYSLEDLKKAYNKGQHYKFLFFWGHTPDSGGRITETCLSQWWMARFEVDGITYSCAEQFMMAEKARMFHDEEMLSLILEAKQPKAMKEYGRSVRDFDMGPCMLRHCQASQHGKVLPKPGTVGIPPFHQEQDTGGGQPKGPHLGNRYGKEQSGCAMPVKVEGH